MRHLREFEEEFSMDDLKDLNKMGFQKLKGWMLYLVADDGYPSYTIVIEESEEKAAKRILALPFFARNVKDIVSPSVKKIADISSKLMLKDLAQMASVNGPFEVKPDIMSPLVAQGPAYDLAFWLGTLEKYFVDLIEKERKVNK